jgi:hypothetical protein
MHNDRFQQTFSLLFSDLGYCKGRKESNDHATIATLYPILRYSTQPASMPLSNYTIRGLQSYGFCEAAAVKGMRETSCSINWFIGLVAAFASIGPLGN